MQIPEMSPMKLDSNPNVQAQVYAVVDNRFLESSTGSDLPIAQKTFEDSPEVK